MRGAVALLAVLLAPTVSALDVPALTGRVVDLADVLGPATEAELTDRLAAHEDSTSNQIVILTVPSLEGEVLETFATRVFRTWGLGQVGTDNGVLLLVAVADRELRIEVGYGLEGALTDATAGSIIRHEIVPRFRDGDFEAGVLAGSDAILRAVNGEYAARAEGEDALGVGLLFTLGLFLFGALPMLSLGGEGASGDVKSAVAGVLLGAPLSFFLWRIAGWRLAGLLVPVALALALVGLNRWLEAHPSFGPKRRHRRKKQAAFADARRRGAPFVIVDGQSYTVPTGSSSGGGDGGGGFSGGGGSSGGGGASGSW